MSPLIDQPPLNGSTAVFSSVPQSTQQVSSTVAASPVPRFTRLTESAAITSLVPQSARWTNSTTAASPVPWSVRQTISNVVVSSAPWSAYQTTIAAIVSLAHRSALSDHLWCCRLTDAFGLPTIPPLLLSTLVLLPQFSFQTNFDIVVAPLKTRPSLEIACSMIAVVSTSSRKAGVPIAKVATRPALKVVPCRYQCRASLSFINVTMMQTITNVQSILSIHVANVPTPMSPGSPMSTNTHPPVHWATRSTAIVVTSSAP
ncbi:hypothetical protein ACLOJK_035649 [Asimina triloba]